MSAALILAAAFAQPCVIPPKPVRHQKHHQAHVALPLQSCVTPPVPMCFREPAPAPEPEIAPLPQPVLYYVLTTRNVVSGSPPPADDVVYYPVGSWSLVGGGVGVIGGGVVPSTVPPASPPSIPPSGPIGGGWYPPPQSFAAPELDLRSGLESTLVLVIALLILANSMKAGL